MRAAMRVILPNCRAQFTAEDVEFVADVLGGNAGRRECLVKLLTDPESRDAILDDEALLSALLERGGFLRVSPHFYFYVLVRRVLKSGGIDDRTVADYVAEVMTEFSRAERVPCSIPGREAGTEYFFEMVAALQQADDRAAFYLRSHIGNQSLFLSGLFLERVRERKTRRGFPGLRYYQELGSSNFRAAGDHHLARRYELSRVFHILGERFDAARRSLNDLADRLVTLGEPALALPNFDGNSGPV